MRLVLFGKLQCPDDDLCVCRDFDVLYVVDPSRSWFGGAHSSCEDSDSGHASRSVASQSGAGLADHSTPSHRSRSQDPTPSHGSRSQDPGASSSRCGWDNDWCGSGGEEGSGEWGSTKDVSSSSGGSSNGSIGIDVGRVSSYGSERASSSRTVGSGGGGAQEGLSGKEAQLGSLSYYRDRIARYTQRYDRVLMLVRGCGFVFRTRGNACRDGGNYYGSGVLQHKLQGDGSAMAAC